jgi:hypothetical protein
MIMELWGRIFENCVYKGLRGLQRDSEGWHRESATFVQLVWGEREWAWIDCSWCCFDCVLLIVWEQPFERGEMLFCIFAYNCFVYMLCWKVSARGGSYKKSNKYLWDFVTKFECIAFNLFIFSHLAGTCGVGVLAKEIAIFMRRFPQYTVVLPAIHYIHSRSRASHVIPSIVQAKQLDP